MAPSLIRSLEAFQVLLKSHDLEISLSNGLIGSTHYFSLDGSKVVDSSMVDGSDTPYTWRQFRASAWGKGLENEGLWVTLSNRRA